MNYHQIIEALEDGYDDYEYPISKGQLFKIVDFNGNGKIYFESLDGSDYYKADKSKFKTVPQSKGTMFGYNYILLSDRLIIGCQNVTRKQIEFASDSKVGSDYMMGERRFKRRKDGFHHLYSDMFFTARKLKSVLNRMDKLGETNGLSEKIG